MAEPDPAATTIHLAPGQGRSYELGAMRAVFKADGAETGDRYSISEWWLEPHASGPGAHRHEANDEVFYVIQGTASILVGETWQEAPTGSFLRIPAKVSCTISGTRPASGWAS